MTVTLHFPPETEKLLREQAAESGQSVESFVRQLVERGLKTANGTAMPPDSTTDFSQEQRLEELRQAVAVGLEEADAGKVGPFSAKATLARIRQRKAKGQETT